MPISARPGSGTRIFAVVRHGATTWSDAGRHTGRTDVPLTEAGRAQAGALATVLSPHRFALVLTSPASRAVQTCELAGFAGRAEVCPELAEWDYGAYEGKTTDEIRTERPGWLLWRDGVEGGESLDDLARRADAVLEAARSTEGDTLAFAHGHILRAVCARWIGLPVSEGARFVFEPASIGLLGWEREVPAVLRWNDRSPLPPG
jgi:broad specificity phosphatase PhoE